mmetsp:Transcript_10480/g.13685  ORF Transcript_10480/g.13685 Transcript_10480/m.13685 type:complete len:208 (+) Transcript_10480:661-1284(+)
MCGQTSSLNFKVRKSPTKSAISPIKSNTPISKAFGGGSAFEAGRSSLDCSIGRSKSTSSFLLPKFLGDGCFPLCGVCRRLKLRSVKSSRRATIGFQSLCTRGRSRRGFDRNWRRPTPSTLSTSVCSLRSLVAMKKEQRSKTSVTILTSLGGSRISLSSSSSFFFASSMASSACFLDFLARFVKNSSTSSAEWDSPGEFSPSSVNSRG